MLYKCLRCRNHSFEKFNTHAICYDCNYSEDYMKEKFYDKSSDSLIIENLEKSEDFCGENFYKDKNGKNKSSQFICNTKTGDTL